MKRYLPFAIIAVVFCMASMAGVELYQSRTEKPAPAGKLAFGKPGADPPHMQGRPRAPVALEEFGDFECEPCSRFFPVLKQAQKEYGDRLSVTFRQFPLVKIHPHAMEAARAAEAAGLQGRFWEMYDSLYNDRFIWIGAGDTRAALALCASHLELDLEKFKKDMDSEEVSKRIAADKERVESLELTRTPAVFVNGDQLTTAPITIEVLRAAIDAALGEKPK